MYTCIFIYIFHFFKFSGIKLFTVSIYFFLVSTESIVMYTACFFVLISFLKIFFDQTFHTNFTSSTFQETIFGFWTPITYHFCALIFTHFYFCSYLICLSLGLVFCSLSNSVVLNWR